MADEKPEEEIEDENENHDDNDEGQSKPRKRFTLTDGTAQILQTVLMYAIVIILTLGVSYCVSIRTNQSVKFDPGDQRNQSFESAGDGCFCQKTCRAGLAYGRDDGEYRR